MMVASVKHFIKNEYGQGMVEYGLILALIALVIFGALSALGGAVNGSLEDFNARFENARGS